MITKLNKILYNIECLDLNIKNNGIQTGFRKIDHLTNGLQDGKLIIIGAREGMGLGAFINSMLFNIAIRDNTPTGIFTFEIRSTLFVKKLLSTNANLSLQKLVRGNISPEANVQFKKSIFEVENAPMYFFDSPQKNLSEIELFATKMVNDFGVKILFFDYLNLLLNIDLKKEDTEKDYFFILKKLKKLALKLKVPIIAKTSLSDDIETRKGHDKRPTISDLPFTKKTMCIADIVSFIYRPEWYGVNYWDDRGQNSTDGEAEFILAQNRDGFTNNIRLKFIAHRGLFENYKIHDLGETFYKNMTGK